MILSREEARLWTLKGWVFRPSGVPVLAERLLKPRQWRTPGGDQMTAEAGDWMITGPDNTQWSINEGLFRETYRANANGTFSKTAAVRAVMLKEPVEVETLEGLAHGRPGDWLLTGARGESWPVADEVFRVQYVVDGESSSK